MWPFRKILLPNRGTYVNFSNPLNGRQWLNLLKPHPRYGITFRPNLDISRKKLGFSFRSNNLGLRGPVATDGGGVALGTSFAMGLSVDNGANWYDLLLDPEYWFNASMPVGPGNHAAVLDDHYTGPGKVLLYLYHPNLWKTALGYVSAAAASRTIFEQLGWRTSLWRTLRLYPRWFAKEIAKCMTGYSIYRRWNGTDFHFNARYSWVDPQAGHAFAESQMADINHIFSQFDKVIAIRTPIKEDSLPDSKTTPRLRSLRANYDHFWSLFQDRVAPHVRCYRLDHSAFSHRHFHPFDTHWNKAGNELFCSMIKPTLAKEGVPGISRMPS